MGTLRAVCRALWGQVWEWNPENLNASSRAREGEAGRQPADLGMAVWGSEKPGFPDKSEPAGRVRSAVYLSFAVVALLCPLKAPMYCLHFNSKEEHAKPAESRGG